MKKLYPYLLIAVIPVVLIIMSNSTGSPGGKTGSPADVSTCFECHNSNPVNPVSAWITTNIPAAGYVAGNTYTITVTGTHSGVIKFGFELTAEDDAAAKTGTFIITDVTQTMLVNMGTAVTHTSMGTSPSGDTKTWTVDWTAPPSSTGDVGFYASFIAANGNGNVNGDDVYTSSTFVSPQPDPGIARALYGRPAR